MVECHPDIFKLDSLKVPKLPFRLSLRAANSLATSTRQSLSVLCLWVFSIVRLLDLVCVITDRSAKVCVWGGGGGRSWERIDQRKCVWVRKGKQGNLADRSFHSYPILSRLELIRGICLMFELMLLLSKHFEDKQKWWWEFKMCDIFNNSQSRVGQVWSAKFAIKFSAQDKKLCSINWCDHDPCIMVELFVLTFCPFDFLLFKASASTQRVNEFETETEVNHIPLQALDNLDMWVNVIS